MINLTKDTKILIIGLGVIGGGYARALTANGYKVGCITKEQKDIDYALNEGIISYGTTEVTEAVVSAAELIIFALYPKTFIEWVEKYQKYFSPGTIITDVCGVKGSIVDKVQSILRDDVEFISHHPMAGREKSGVEYSDASVFKGANFIVVPTEKNTKDAINICLDLGKIIGFSNFSTISPAEHDEMIAFLSQLTHCIAVTLMNSYDAQGLELYTGDSFRDLTRIAKINDNMWSELFLLNKDMLLAQMDSFIYEFSVFRKLLAMGDSEAIRQKMRDATLRRELFDKPTHPKANTNAEGNNL